METGKLVSVDINLFSGTLGRSVGYCDPRAKQALPIWANVYPLTNILAAWFIDTSF